MLTMAYLMTKGSTGLYRATRDMIAALLGPRFLFMVR